MVAFESRDSSSPKTGSLLVTQPKPGLLLSAGCSQFHASLMNVQGPEAVHQLLQRRKNAEVV
jgi:hypothetical protein